MEGISNEACSLAGHWGLGKLIALYDDNRISIDGHTEISFTEDVAARFEALGWHVQHVKDGNTDLKSIREAIEAAKAVTDKPSFIKVRAWARHSAAKVLSSRGAPLHRVCRLAPQCLLSSAGHASRTEHSTSSCHFCRCKCRPGPHGRAAHGSAAAYVPCRSAIAVPGGHAATSTSGTP